MKFFKHDKASLISDENFGSFKESSKENAKNNDLQSKTEVAIMKSIFLTQLKGDLKILYSDLERREEEFKRFPANSLTQDNIELTELRIDWVKEMIKQVNDIPDMLYKVSKPKSTVLEFTDVAGNSFELYLLKRVVGGTIYQLKANSSGKTIDIVTTKSNYFSIIESCCFNGYLFSEKRICEALSQLRNEKDGRSVL